LLLYVNYRHGQLVLGKEFFLQLISEPFQQGFLLAFAISTLLTLLAALAYLLRGQRVIYGQDLNAMNGVDVGHMAE